MEKCCSFCGKGEREVKQIISGPGTTCICDECVVLSYEVLIETGVLEGERPPSAPKPADEQSAEQEPS